MKKIILCSLIFAMTQITFASAKSSLVCLQDSKKTQEEDPRPIVVVLHGQNSTPAGVDKSLDGCIRQMSGLLTAIKPLYKEVYFFHYDFFKRVEETGADFSRYLEELTATNKNIHVIAHSMGGLIARQALEHGDQDFEAVKHLVTLGTPHCGLTTKVDGVLVLAKSFGPLVGAMCPQYLPLLALAESLPQLVRSSETMTQLNAKEREIRTCYHIIQGKISAPTPKIPISPILAGFLEDGQFFDGVVTVATEAELTSILSTKSLNVSVVEGLNHNQMIQAKYAPELVKYLKSFCLEAAAAEADDDWESLLDGALEEVMGGQ